jgi:cell division protein FtsW
LLVGIFAFIVIRGLIKVRDYDDHFTSLAASGLLCEIAVQSIVNIGVNVNIFPTKGMTLPFVSYGGCSMLTIAISFGMIIALTRRKADMMKFRTFDANIYTH